MRTSNQRRPLLRKLERINRRDSNGPEARKVRRQLRALGHRGGLRQAR